MNLHATFTHPFSREPFTTPRDLHARRAGERKPTFTDTFTPFTRPDLHARTPLYKGGRVGLDPIQTALEGPR